MEEKIIKNEDGTFSIVKETTEVVDLAQLEQELAEIQQFNLRVEQAELVREQLPDELKGYVSVLGIMPTTVLEEKINKLKAING